MTSPTPWTERQFRFDFSTGLFPVIFSRLEGTLFRLSSILASAEDEASSYSPQGWSVKQHLGHLSDLEDLWWTRINDYFNGAVELTHADVTNPRTEAAGHNEKTLEQLMLRFTFDRQKTLEAIFELDEVTLSLTALHPRLRIPMRLIDHLYFVAEHDDHHIAAISNLLRAPSGEFV